MTIGPDIRDWSEGFLALGPPIFTNAAAGNGQTSFLKGVSSWPYIVTMVQGNGTDVKVEYDWSDPGIVFGPVDSIHVGSNLVAVIRHACIMPSVQVTVFTNGGATAKIYIAPSASGQPRPEGDGGYILAHRSDTIAAGANVDVEILWRAGRAHVLLAPVTQPATVTLNAYDFQGNLLARLYSFTLAAGQGIDRDIDLPPYVVKLKILNTGAAPDTYLTDITATMGALY